MRIAKVLLVLVMSLGLVFTPVPSASADETSDLILKLLLKKGVITQADVDGITRDLPAKQASAPKGIEERVEALEARKGFLSPSGYKVDVSGTAEIEYVDMQGDRNAWAIDTATSEINDSDNPRLQVDKVTLRLTAMSEDENIGFTTELEYDEGDTAFFDDAYVFVKNIELGETTNSFKVGLMDRFFRMKRLIESYPLNGTAWWQDEEYAVIYSGEYDDGWLYWYGELARANELNDRSNTEGTQFEMIHDNRRTSNSAEIADNLAVGAGVGVRVDTADYTTEDLGTFDILAFGRIGEITDDDTAFLRGITGYISDDDDYSRVGLNLTYKLNNFGLRGQVMHAVDGSLDSTGLYIEPYYYIPVGWKYLDSVTPVVQVSWLDVNLSPTIADARTWDRTKCTIGSVWQINNNVRLVNEYSINSENTGAADVRNNEFISNLKYSF